MTENLYGYTMVGYLYMEDGFVLDVSGFVIDKRNTKAVIKPVNITISSSIIFKHIEIFQDFKIKFENQTLHTDIAIGGLIIKPETFYLEYTVCNIFIGLL